MRAIRIFFQAIPERAVFHAPGKGKLRFAKALRLDPLEAGVHGVAIRKARNSSGRDHGTCREGGRSQGYGFLPFGQVAYSDLGLFIYLSFSFSLHLMTHFPIRLERIRDQTKIQLILIVLGPWEYLEK